ASSSASESVSASESASVSESTSGSVTTSESQSGGLDSDSEYDSGDSSDRGVLGVSREKTGAQHISAADGGKVLGANRRVATGDESRMKSNATMTGISGALLAVWTAVRKKFRKER
ncbi:MAG: hypothetical protein Q4G57_05270, partial [Bacillota bacterium]|nr:hypothetical protein [Bacillota bacterium]